MRSDIVIAVKNLAKTYRIFGHSGDRILQALTFGQVRFHKEFTALQEVTFEIKKGEAVGIIGRNGSGKSTLLQLICGILKPTTGEVQVHGRISALLELGSGFNPEFTGRENIYFQSAVMGFSRHQMNERISDIIDFADIGAFIDQPVRTYSSGMFVRPAFAVAISVEPSLLVVDEALSVGDVVFQHKSRKRVQELIDAGTSLLLVSHDRSMITSTCSRCILLDKGRVLMDGQPSDVFDYYHALTAVSGSEHIQQNHLDSGRAQVVSGTGEARVKSIRLLSSDGNELNVMEVGTPVILEFLVHTFQAIPCLVLAFAIRDRLGQTMFNTNTNCFNKSPENVSTDTALVFRFHLNANMGPGSYSISSFLTSTNDRFSNNYESHELAYFFEITNESNPYFLGNAWLHPELDVKRIE